MKIKKGFTLIEMMIVVIVLAILAILAIPQYTKAMERTAANSAITNLNLIAAAQQSYRLENSRFYPSPGQSTSNTTEINSALRLSLADTSDWTYDVIAGAQLDCGKYGCVILPPSYSVIASRQGSGPYSGCTYSIQVNTGMNTTLPEPTKGENCP